MDANTKILECAYIAMHIPGYDIKEEFLAIYTQKTKEGLNECILQFKDGKLRWLYIRELILFAPSKVCEELANEQEAFSETYRCICDVVELGVEHIKNSYLPNDRILR